MHTAQIIDRLREDPNIQRNLTAWRVQPRGRRAISPFRMRWIPVCVPRSKRKACIRTGAIARCAGCNPRLAAVTANAVDWRNAPRPTAFGDVTRLFGVY